MTAAAKASAAAVFLGVFAFYAATAYPAIAPRDGADLAWSARTLGLSHPPGYPLYSLLGKAWASALGLGEPAYRLNLLSAAAGAGAAALVMLAVGGVGGLAGALSLALCAPLWKFCLLQEKYSLHVLLAAGLFFLARGAGGTQRRRLMLSGLVFGLSLVNHQTALFWLPALLILWRGKGVRPWAAIASAMGGMGLMLMLWIRLGGLPAAWAMAVRAEYGTFELHPGLAQPFSLGLAAGQLDFFARGLARAMGVPALVLSAVGAAELWRRDRAFGAALGAAFAVGGPFFLVASRFDPSAWVARSVLEPCFLIPCLALAVASGMGAARLASEGSRLGLSAGTVGMVLCAALSAAGLWRLGPSLNRRDDFSAYDYARDLDRSIPPGAAAVVGGDTARFALRYLSLDRGDKGRLLVGSDAPLGPVWAASQAQARPLYATGLSAEALGRIGLWGNPGFPSPDGLVQKAGPALTLAFDRPAWERLALRRPAGARREPRDSYLRDVHFSYAFAHYLSGRIHEVLAREGPPFAGSSRHYLEAGFLEPEEYRVEWKPFGNP